MSRNFNEADKQRIMKEYSNSGLNVPGYSRQSGVSETTLYKWQNEQRSKSLGNQINNSNSLEEFIELGANKNTHYEIRCKEICLKIPITESVSRITAIFKGLSEC